MRGVSGLEESKTTASWPWGINRNFYAINLIEIYAINHLLYAINLRLIDRFNSVHTCLYVINHLKSFDLIRKSIFFRFAVL